MRQKTDTSPTSSPFSTFPQVNIIPIIAKADTVSKSELHKFKIKIMSELVSNGVQIYQFPTDDEAVSEINASMNVSSTPWKWSMSCFFFCFFLNTQNMLNYKTGGIFS